MLICKAFNSVKISNIVRCYRIVYLDGNTRFREHCNRTVGSLKSTAAAAKFFIGCFGCSVKRDIHPLRRELSEQFDLFFADHRSVCVYRNDNAEFTASAIDFFKIGPNKRLASGQQQKQHAALLRFLCNVQPFLRGKFVRFDFAVIFFAMDIAHAAAEIAARRKLKRSGKRNAPFCALCKKPVHILRIFHFIHLLPVFLSATEPRGSPPCSAAQKWECTLPRGKRVPHGFRASLRRKARQYCSSLPSKREHPKGG